MAEQERTKEAGCLSLVGESQRNQRGRRRRRRNHVMGPDGVALRTHMKFSKLRQDSDRRLRTMWLGNRDP